MMSMTTTTVLADQFIELKSAPRLISMVQFPPKAAGATGRKSVQFEVDGEVEEDVHRLPIERPRFEFPAPDRFHRGLIESEGKRLEDMNVGHVAGLVDGPFDDDDAGDAGLAGHFRTLRLDRGDDE